MGPRLTFKNEGFAEVIIGFADLYLFLDLTVVPISVPKIPCALFEALLPPDQARDPTIANTC